MEHLPCWQGWQEKSQEGDIHGENSPADKRHACCTRFLETMEDKAEETRYISTSD